MSNVLIPVLEDMNGYIQITMYTTTTDGNFKRTAKRPFRGMTRLINGVGSQVGVVEMNPRMNVTWRTPTVSLSAERGAESVYQFFRTKLEKNQYYIATTDNLRATTRNLNLHLVAFKMSASAGVKRLFGNKCVEAMEIWGTSTKT